jgi:hypothetical protein
MTATERILARLAELRRETQDLEQALLVSDTLDPRLTPLISVLEEWLGGDLPRWWSTPIPGSRHGAPRVLALAGDLRAVAAAAGVPRAHDLRF